MRGLSERAPAWRTGARLWLMLALLASCAGRGEHPALDQAGAAVERARSAPRVRALAAAELDRAEAALEQARAAARAGASPDQVEHLGYVASQRAALAEARAAERIARTEIGKRQRALGQTLAHGPERVGQTRASPRQAQTTRALAQVRLEQDGQVRASSAPSAQGVPTPPEPDHGRAAPAEDQREHAAPEPRQRVSVRQDEQIVAAQHDDQREHASVRRDQRASAPPDQEQQERAAMWRGQSGPEPLPQEQQDPAALRQGQQTRAPREEDRREPAALREGQSGPASLGQDQRALHMNRRERAPVSQDRERPAPVDQDQPEHPSLPRDQQSHRAPEGNLEQRVSGQAAPREPAPLHQDPSERAAVPQDRQTRVLLKEEYRERTRREENRQDRALVQKQQREPPSRQADQQAFATQAEVAAAAVGMVPQEITLRLATLPFEGEEPTGDTVEQLAALAERLLREPALSVSIEAAFEAPDPETRTEMEHRVEVVRAMLVRRGVAPMRLVVRPAGPDPTAPPATSSRVEPLE